MSVSVVTFQMALLGERAQLQAVLHTRVTTVDYFSFRELYASLLAITCVWPPLEVSYGSEVENRHTIQKPNWQHNGSFD